MTSTCWHSKTTACIIQSPSTLRWWTMGDIMYFHQRGTRISSINNVVPLKLLNCAWTKICMYVDTSTSKCTYVCRHGLRTYFCGLRTDLCRHTVHTLRTADTIFCGWKVLGTFQYQEFFTKCGHTVDNRQVFAGTLRTLWAKLPTLWYLLRNIFESCMIKYIYSYIRTYRFFVMHD
jgi:hypothetical protein